MQQHQQGQESKWQTQAAPLYGAGGYYDGTAGAQEIDGSVKEPEGPRELSEVEARRLELDGRESAARWELMEAARQEM